MQFERQCDILVAGAGVAGVAAALEAARAGLDTILVEKTIFTGGLATTGLINIYLPLCDGRGTQVIYGIAEELLQRSLRFGPGDVPQWREANANGRHPRYQVAFSPAAFILALDEALEEAGVDVWLDTLVCSALLEGERVAGVEVENKSGRGAIRARCVIDATGDADVAARAGAACARGENFLSFWGEHFSRTEGTDPTGGAGSLAGLRLGYLSEWSDTAPERRRYEATDGRDVSAFVLDSRRLARERYRARQEQLGSEGRSRLFPVTLPAMAQFRMTRRIAGQATLTGGQEGGFFADSIGLSPDWRKAGPIWEIPYGTLLPRAREGLLAAGRCISTEGDAWDVLRVIPPAALTGQAAGIAATLAVRGGTVPSRVTPAAVQTELKARGIPYHIGDVRG